MVIAKNLHHHMRTVDIIDESYASIALKACELIKSTHKYEEIKIG
jgi:hypothetical protein